VAGTKAETIIEVLRKIPESLRKKVSEITLDMAGSMTMIAKRCFPKATRVTDRFHVQILAIEALQEIRIKHRWEALDQENDAIEQAKAANGVNPQDWLLDILRKMNDPNYDGRFSDLLPNRWKLNQ
jgi:transposase